MEKKWDVIVLCGGWSGERMVSLRSGTAVHQACRDFGLNAKMMDLQSAKDLLLLHEVHPETKIFNVLHGGSGEDGFMSGYLDGLGLSYTGAGRVASALAMDKHLSKSLFKAHGIPTLPWFLLKSKKDLIEAMPRITYPACFKPSNAGSSLGVSRVEHPDQAEAAFDLAHAIGPVMVEPWVMGQELAVGWLDGQALSPIWIEPVGNAFYDYEAKYQSHTTRYHLPCGLLDHEIEMLKSLTQQVAKVLDFRGWARIDFIRDQEQFYVVEANATPGMTATSLVPQAAAYDGIDFPNLVGRILDLATYDPI